MTSSESIEKIRKKYPAKLGRAKAVKLYCRESCCAGDHVAWRECYNKACFLWNFRMGREIVGIKADSKKKCTYYSVNSAKTSILQVASGVQVQLKLGDNHAKN